MPDFQNHVQYRKITPKVHCVRVHHGSRKTCWIRAFFLGKHPLNTWENCRVYLGSKISFSHRDGIKPLCCFFLLPPIWRLETFGHVSHDASQTIATFVRGHPKWWFGIRESPPPKKNPPTVIHVWEFLWFAQMILIINDFQTSWANFESTNSPCDPSCLADFPRKFSELNQFITPVSKAAFFEDLWVYLFSNFRDGTETRQNKQRVWFVYQYQAFAKFQQEVSFRAFFGGRQTKTLGGCWALLFRGSSPQSMPRSPVT